jgi:hypothetical protein
MPVFCEGTQEIDVSKPVLSTFAIVFAALGTLALSCGKVADVPSNPDEVEPGVTNAQPSLGSYGTGGDGTNGGAYDPAAVGAGVSNPTSAGSVHARAADAGPR